MAKICNTCHKEKEDDEFRVHNENGNRLSKCIKCQNEQNNLKDLLCCIEHKLSFSKRAKNGCGKCFGSVIDLDTFIKKSKEDNGDRFLYDKAIYTTKGDKKIVLICKIHGDFKIGIDKHLYRGDGCPLCSYYGPSKGELELYRILDKLKEYYQKEFVFDNNKNFSFDIYLVKYNLVIEFDGEFHYDLLRFKKSKEILSKTKIRDELKNQYCKDNNINILRIPYWEINNIENIIINKLREYGKITSN